jgi:hypothetical protein
MTLLHLLHAICFSIAVGGAIGAAKHSQVGVMGDLLAVVIGGIMGVAWTWANYKFGKMLYVRAQEKSQRSQNVSAITTFAVLIMSLPLADITSGTVTTTFLKLLMH